MLLGVLRRLGGFLGGAGAVHGVQALKGLLPDYADAARVGMTGIRREEKLEPASGLEPLTC